MPCRRSGFTLVEVLLSIAILGVSALAISRVYTAGPATAEIRVAEGRTNSALRSRMEKLQAMQFDHLSSGSETVVIQGDDLTLSWTVSAVDLDGDLTPEASAKLITVTLGDRSLTTIVVDHGGRIGKI